MTTQKRRKPMTAAEHQKLLDADPVFQAQRAERERIRQQEIAKLRVASKPLVEDLHAAGFPVNGVWDFVNTRERYDAALPVLATHLERNYPPEILEGIARAMAVPEAMPWREDFIRLIRIRPPMPEGKRDGFRDGLAIAIGNTTGPHNVWETIALLRDTTLGSSRILMLSVLGKVKEPEVKEALLELRECDPELRRVISDLGWVKKLDREHKQAGRSISRD